MEPLAYFFLRENLQRFAAETYDIGRARLVLRAGLSRRGAALVGLPADRARPPAALGRPGDEPRRALPRALAVAGAGSPEPVAGQDRLLPAAAVSRGLAARSAATWPATPWGRLDRALGASRPARAGGGARAPPGAAAPGAARVAARRNRPGRARRGAGRRGGRTRRRRLAPVSRPRARGPRGARRPGLGVRRRAVPAGVLGEPAERRDREGRGARAPIPAGPAHGLLLRPDARRGATCCSRCGSRRSPSATCGASLARASRSCCSRPPPRTRPSASTSATATSRPTATCRRRR